MNLSFVKQPSWKWYLLPAIIFALVVSVNFTKPFGFFRESNPALVAISGTYWQQHPEIRKHHIPVYSYAFDEHLPPATQFDNTVTTFGYAWFETPYYFLQALNMPIGPVGLRIFSVAWLLFTLIAVYKLSRQLLQQVAQSKTVTWLTIILYAFSPVAAWYQVNGYVHETAVLPMYYLGWYFFLRLLQENNIKWLWLTAICLFVSIQFDWLPFFQGMVMSAYLLFFRKNLSRWMFIVPGSFIMLGIAYIVYHYTSWSSAKDYFHFMQWKFGTRTVGEEGPSYLSFWPAQLNIVLFYALGYGVILLWTIIAFLKKKIDPLVLLMIVTALLHHLVFWGFSSEHDYSTLKMAFPIAFMTALLISGMKIRVAVASVSCILVLCIVQYFLLHNYHYRKGMYADDRFFVRAGMLVKSQPTDALVFADTENKYFPQLEFYAGRSYTMASSVEDARGQLSKSKLTKGVWIQYRDGVLVATRFTAGLPNKAPNVQVSDTTKGE